MLKKNGVMKTFIFVLGLFGLLQAHPVASVQIGPADGSGNYSEPNIVFVVLTDGGYFWFDSNNQNGKAMLATILSAHTSGKEITYQCYTNKKYFKSSTLTGPAWFANYQTIEVGCNALSISIVN